MELNEFQQSCMDNSVYPLKRFSLEYFTMALCGEAGEVANEVTKCYRDEGNILTPERKELLLNEMGNTFYYLSRMASILEVSLEDLAKRQIENCIKKRKELLKEAKP